MHYMNFNVRIKSKIHSMLFSYFALDAALLEKVFTEMFPMLIQSISHHVLLMLYVASSRKSCFLVVRTGDLWIMSHCVSARAKKIT